MSRFSSEELYGKAKKIYLVCFLIAVVFLIIGLVVDGISPDSKFTSVAELFFSLCGGIALQFLLTRGILVAASDLKSNRTTVWLWCVLLIVGGWILGLSSGSMAASDSNLLSGLCTFPAVGDIVYITAYIHAFDKADVYCHDHRCKFSFSEEEAANLLKWSYLNVVVAVPICLIIGFLSKDAVTIVGLVVYPVFVIYLVYHLYQYSKRHSDTDFKKGERK